MPPQEPIEAVEDQYNSGLEWDNIIMTQANTRSRILPRAVTWMMLYTNFGSFA